jgi:hypothetical protein
VIVALVKSEKTIKSEVKREMIKRVDDDESLGPKAKFELVSRWFPTVAARVQTWV